MKRKAVTLQLEGEIPQPQSAYDAAVEDGYEGSEEQYAKELATIPPTQEQFDAIPGRVCKLTTTTEKSDFHHITDSAADSVLDFGMEGKTEQETTPGNQLFDKNSIAIINELLQNDGTPFPNVNYVHTDFIEVTPNETYSLTMFNTAYLFSGIWVYDESKTFVEKPSSYLNSYSIAENGKYLILGFTKAEYGVFTEDDIKAVSDGLMLVKGSTKPTTYEPYTNGPSPNPDYPQEIANAGKLNEETGKYEHKCCVGNKNILNMPELLGKVYSNLSITKDITISAKYTDDFKLMQGAIWRVRAGYKDGSSNYIMDYAFPGTFPATESNPIVELEFRSSHITAGNYYDIQCEYGAVATDYVPYTETPFTLTSDRPLTKWDDLVKRDGIWGWSVLSKEYNPNDVMSIACAGYSSDVIRFCIYDIQGIKNTECYCNLFRYSKDANFTLENICTFAINDYIWCTVSAICLASYGYTYNSEASSGTNHNNACTAFKALLADKGGIKVLVNMQEELAFHPLPDEEQELLNNLETYYGVTNLYNDQGCPMWLTYVQDTKTAVDNKFNNIKQALLSLGANV